MDRLAYYAFALALVAIPTALIFLAAKFAHRVCTGHRWTQRVACGVTLIYLCLLLIPFLFGPEAGALWILLALPFALPFEYLASLGYIPFVVVTSIVAASFWGTLLYVLFAIILLIRRKWRHRPSAVVFRT
jgi:uncharacterized membrane protein